MSRTMCPSMRRNRQKGTSEKSHDFAEKAPILGWDHVFWYCEKSISCVCQVSGRYYLCFFMAHGSKVEKTCIEGMNRRHLQSVWSHHWQTFHLHSLYPLVNVNKKLWKITIFHGKIHYFYGDFCIVMLNYQRVWGLVKKLPELFKIHCLHQTLKAP